MLLLLCFHDDLHLLLAGVQNVVVLVLPLHPPLHLLIEQTLLDGPLRGDLAQPGDLLHGCLVVEVCLSLEPLFVVGALVG